MPFTEAMREALIIRANTAIQTLRELPVGLARIVTDVRREVGRIWLDGDLADTARQPRIEQAREAARAQLERLIAAAQAARETAESALREAAQGAPTTEPVLEELRLQRAWDRIKDRLQRQWAEAVPVAIEAAERRDAATFAALREELPAMLGEEHVARSEIERLMGEIDALEAPLLTELQRMARERQTELAESWARQVVATISSARAELAGYGWVPALVDWDGTLLELPEPPRGAPGFETLLGRRAR